MSDYREEEKQEQKTPTETRSGRPSREAISRIQGDVDTSPSESPDDADLATVHSGDSIEGGPKPETQPETVRLDTKGENEQAKGEHPEGRKPEPPEGWHPGGVESGG